MQRIAKRVFALGVAGMIMCLCLSLGIFGIAKAEPAPNNIYSATATKSFTEKLYAYFANTELATNTYEAALALNAMGHGDKVNTASVIALLEEAETDAKITESGVLAKYILMLAAGGVDPTQVTIAGETRNLVKEMIVGAENYSNLWGIPMIIRAYDYVDADVEGASDIINALIDSLLASKNSEMLLDGGWGSDIDLTSEAVNALLPRASRHDVQAFLDTAKDALLGYLQSNGSIDSWGGTYADSTAKAVCALVALGVDVTTDEGMIAPNGSSAVGFLCSFDGSDNDMSLGKIYLALVAVQGYTESGYNVYSFTSLPQVPDVPKTGDGTPGDVLALCACAAIATVGAYIARKRIA